MTEQELLRRRRVCGAITAFCDYGVGSGLLAGSEDKLFVRNRILSMLRFPGWEEPRYLPHTSDMDAILDTLADYAIENSILVDTVQERENFETMLFGCLCPLPHTMIYNFRQKYHESPRAATDWYYDTCVKIDYVRARKIAKNLSWIFDSAYGSLEITVNLSKPEKDPREIAKAKNAPQSGYPKCALCMENIGYAGSLNQAARQNLLPIPMHVASGKWEFQYSPYGYFNEHCIVFNREHVPMKIDVSTFENLLSLLDTLPHYFFGSNADLPIVGGSILAHDHFQGGRHVFPIEKAGIRAPLQLPGLAEVTGGVLNWPMSVVRLRSRDKGALVRACTKVWLCWREYSDADAEILAYTEKTPHNTITPIARRHGDVYEFDLVLRNNRTTPERPYGLFHPRESLHHIKKENIGLIEVMGLAILPGRLAGDMDEMKRALREKLSLDAMEHDARLHAHAAWLAGVIARYPAPVPEENLENILRNEIGRVFEEVLLDAGVFKETEDGRAAFSRFLETLAK